MRIQLRDNFVITCDDKQFILNKSSIALSGKKEGEEILSAVSYHGTMESLLNHFIDRQILKSQAQDLETLLGELKELREYVSTLVK